MEIDNALCRHLSGIDICQIGLAAFPRPSKSGVIDAGHCAVSDDPKGQLVCDCFVPKQRLDTSEWLKNFQEG